jgi:hypothetical protein
MVDDDGLAGDPRRSGGEHFRRTVHSGDIGRVAQKLTGPHAA